MDLSIIHSRALSGLDAPPVRVETHLSNGLPAFHIVGLPETAVRESKDRVRSAIINSHFEFPNRRITINLAPADLPKGGGRFDLPIALGILTAAGQVPLDRIPAHEFLGELALDGGLRAVPGTLAAACSIGSSGRRLVVPTANASSAARMTACEVIAAPDLLTLCAHLNGRSPLTPFTSQAADIGASYPDLADVVGQQTARRALEIAACGGHNLLLYGPPGTGKTLLASRLPGLLPPADPAEILVGLALRDMGSTDWQPDDYQRPFRAPHHSSSASALVGGGITPRPGEISLAHGGILFLDELPEFNRSCLEALREPLESGKVTISRARQTVTFPARFQLVAAMNPCPCGFLGDTQRQCRCAPDQLQRYRARLSGPLVDRIDLHVPVTRPSPEALLDPGGGNESSAQVRERVDSGHRRQRARQGKSNAALGAPELLNSSRLEMAGNRLLRSAADRLALSGRSLHRVLRVARTIADLEDAGAVGAAHISEALAFRGLDNEAPADPRF
jgi:magnesium chelatase family protein